MGFSHCLDIPNPLEWFTAAAGTHKASCPSSPPLIPVKNPWRAGELLFHRECGLWSGSSGSPTRVGFGQKWSREAPNSMFSTQNIPYFTSVLQRGPGRSCQVIKGCGHELGSSGKVPGVVRTGSQGFVSAGAIPHRVIIPQEFRGPHFLLGRKKKKSFKIKPSKLS